MCVNSNILLVGLFTGVGSLKYKNTLKNNNPIIYYERTSDECKWNIGKIKFILPPNCDNLGVYVLDIYIRNYQRHCVSVFCDGNCVIKTYRTKPE